MSPHTLISLTYFYGMFLIVCGIASVIFIGSKAKTALISGGTSGVISLLIGYLLSAQTSGAQLASIILPLALFMVFAWRSTKTLHTVFELILSGSDDLKGKGTAFLIISLMAVVSIFVFVLQVVNYA